MSEGNLPLEASYVIEQTVALAAELRAALSLSSLPSQAQSATKACGQQGRVNVGARRFAAPTLSLECQ